MSEDGLDMRGAVIDSAEWERIRAAAPREDGRLLLRDARFDGATFRIKDLDTVIFERASFSGARFERDVSFGRTTFRSGERRAIVGAFDRTVFDGDASFFDASFAGVASFAFAHFHGAWTTFAHARFDEPVDFLDAAFDHTVSFQATAFDNATFNGASFGGLTGFDDVAAGSGAFVGARFDDELDMRRATFRELNLSWVRYAHPLTLGPLTVHGLLRLDDAVFEEPVTLVAAANYLSAERTRFRDRASLELRWAEVALDGAQFARPSTVALGEEIAYEPTFQERDRSWHPRVVSLRNADVDGLFLAGVDLRACRMHGARNLDRLRIGSGCRFARSPRGWRWADREALAEEHLWRGGEWNPPECHAPDWLRDADRVPPPGVIAGLYRDLRKAREDHKDEPGAASFYYGEMEMRRHDPRSELAERAILYLYWLVAGYGLRASRALAALAVTVLVSAVVLASWGFDPDQGFGRALLFSAESTSSLFRVPPTIHFELATVGEITQLVVRLLGPLFFALALISLRGRVKRG